jgi:drug/metabolite transporter (DMT)-like permease
MASLTGIGLSGVTRSAKASAAVTADQPKPTGSPLSPLMPLGHWLWDRAYILLSLTSLFWAINIVLGRFIAGTVPPVALTDIRWGGAAAIAVPVAWPHLKRDWPVIRRNLPVLVFLSFTGITVYNTLAYHGLEMTEAINGLLMQSAGPFIIAIWSLVLFRDRLTVAQFFGILASMLGVVAIITRGDLAALLSLRLNEGDLWILAALVLYGLYSSCLRLRPPIHPLSFIAFTMAIGALMLLPAAVVEYLAGRYINPTPAAFAVLVYVAIFPSLVAYICFNRGVELIGANRAGPFFHLMPVFGSIIAIAFLGERPEMFHGLGYALILGGIFVAQIGARRGTAMPAAIAEEDVRRSNASPG